MCLSYKTPTSIRFRTWAQVGAHTRSLVSMDGAHLYPNISVANLESFEVTEHRERKKS